MHARGALMLAALVVCAGIVAANARSGSEAAASPAPSPTPTPPFVYCPPSTFANCTVARCIPNGSGGYACNCFLDGSYSATAYESGCQPATATTAQSRFHPIAAYQECTDRGGNTPDWAWCLGVSCTIPGPHSTNAWCACTLPPKDSARFPYVVVTGSFLPNGCKPSPTGDVWSSATVDDSAQITAFLRQQSGLQNLPKPVVVTGNP